MEAQLTPSFASPDQNSSFVQLLVSTSPSACDHPTPGEAAAAYYTTGHSSASASVPAAPPASSGPSAPEASYFAFPAAVQAAPNRAVLPPGFASPPSAPSASGRPPARLQATPAGNFASPPAAPPTSGGPPATALATPASFTSPPAAPPASGRPPTAALATPAGPPPGASARPATGGPVTPWPDAGVSTSSGGLSGARCSQTLQSLRGSHDARPGVGASSTAVRPAELPAAASVGPTPVSCPAFSSSPA
jgi:hypothetical protein